VSDGKTARDLECGTDVKAGANQFVELILSGDRRGGIVVSRETFDGCSFWFGYACQPQIEIASNASSRLSAITLGTLSLQSASPPHLLLNRSPLHRPQTPHPILLFRHHLPHLRQLFPRLLGQPLTSSSRFSATRTCSGEKPCRNSVGNTPSADRYIVRFSGIPSITPIATASIGVCATTTRSTSPPNKQ
jgi:hypothetical protein